MVICIGLIKEQVMEKREISCRGIRFAVRKDGVEAGRASLYLLRNDLHEAPFGLLEDVSVAEDYRCQGIATELVQAVIDTARAEGCYKLIATSRSDGTRESVHAWYRRLGFQDYGTEFRLNLAP